MRRVLRDEQTWFTPILNALKCWKPCKISDLRHVPVAWNSQRRAKYIVCAPWKTETPGNAYHALSGSWILVTSNAFGLLLGRDVGAGPPLPECLIDSKHLFCIISICDSIICLWCLSVRWVSWKPESLQLHEPFNFSVLRGAQQSVILASISCLKFLITPWWQKDP